MVHVQEVKTAYEQMTREDPAAARQLSLNYKINANGRRDSDGLVKIVTSWSRQRRVSMKSGMIECDERAFLSHWPGRGRTEAEAKKLWVQATAPKQFQSGMAWYVNKAILVWVLKPRELDNEDVLTIEQSGGSQEMFCNQSQAQSMLRTAGGVQLASSCKHMFGGFVFKTTHDDDAKL